MKYWYVKEAQDIKVPVKNIGDYVYHSTLKTNFISISNDMILYPSEKTNWGGSLGDKSIGKIYFSRTKNGAEYYGNMLEDTLTLKIPVNNLKNAFYDKESKSYLSKEDIYTTKPVSLKNSFVWNGEEWRKLNKDMCEAIGYGEWNEY